MDELTSLEADSLIGLEERGVSWQEIKRRHNGNRQIDFFIFVPFSFSFPFARPDHSPRYDTDLWQNYTILSGHFLFLVPHMKGKYRVVLFEAGSVLQSGSSPLMRRIPLRQTLKPCHPQRQSSFHPSPKTLPWQKGGAPRRTRLHLHLFFYALYVRLLPLLYPLVALPTAFTVKE